MKVLGYTDMPFGLSWTLPVLASEVSMRKEGPAQTPGGPLLGVTQPLGRGQASQQ